MPGRDGRDVDPVARELGAEGVGEADQGEFAGLYGSHVRDGDFAADRGDVDDPAAARAAHVRDGLLDRLNGAQKCSPSPSRSPRRRHVVEGADFDDAGVVDQHVDPAVAIDHALDRA